MESKEGKHDNVLTISDFDKVPIGIEGGKNFSEDPNYHDNHFHEAFNWSFSRRSPTYLTSERMLLRKVERIKVAIEHSNNMVGPENSEKKARN